MSKNRGVHGELNVSPGGLLEGLERLVDFFSFFSIKKQEFMRPDRIQDSLWKNSSV